MPLFMEFKQLFAISVKSFSSKSKKAPCGSIRSFIPVLLTLQSTRASSNEPFRQLHKLLCNPLHRVPTNQKYLSPIITYKTIATTPSHNMHVNQPRAIPYALVNTMPSANQFLRIPLIQLYHHHLSTSRRLRNCQPTQDIGTHRREHRRIRANQVKPLKR